MLFSFIHSFIHFIPSLPPSLLSFLPSFFPFLLLFFFLIFIRRKKTLRRSCTDQPSHEQAKVKEKKKKKIKNGTGSGTGSGKGFAIAGRRLQASCRLLVFVTLSCLVLAVFVILCLIHHRNRHIRIHRHRHSHQQQASEARARRNKSFSLQPKLWHRSPTARFRGGLFGKGPREPLELAALVPLLVHLLRLLCDVGRHTVQHELHLVGAWSHGGVSSVQDARHPGNDDVSPRSGRGDLGCRAAERAVRSSADLSHVFEPVGSPHCALRAGAVPDDDNSCPIHRVRIQFCVIPLSFCPSLFLTLSALR